MADQVLGLHTAIYCLVDGMLFTRETSITIEQASNSTDVDTVPLGFSGVTPGSAKATVTIENSLPEEDMEYNPTPVIRANAVIELGVIISNRQMVAKGFLKKVNYKHGVNQNAVQSIEGTFRMADFQ
jgi:hypothetical protein